MHTLTATRLQPPIALHLGAQVQPSVAVETKFQSKNEESHFAASLIRFLTICYILGDSFQIETRRYRRERTILLTLQPGTLQRAGR